MLLVPSCRKIWQELGNMNKRTAQSQYIEIVTEIAPDWKNPLSADSALLVRSPGRRCRRTNLMSI